MRTCTWPCSQWKHGNFVARHTMVSGTFQGRGMNSARKIEEERGSPSNGRRSAATQPASYQSAPWEWIAPADSQRKTAAEEKEHESELEQMQQRLAMHWKRLDRSASPAPSHCRERTRAGVWRAASTRLPGALAKRRSLQRMRQVVVAHCWRCTWPRGEKGAHTQRPCTALLPVQAVPWTWLAKHYGASCRAPSKNCGAPHSRDVSGLPGLVRSNQAKGRSYGLSGADAARPAASASSAIGGGGRAGGGGTGALTGNPAQLSH